jgi:hypothetical protein
VVKTVLAYAVEAGHEDMVAFLLSKGAQANHVDECGKTAVMMGCEKGHLNVVRLLVEHTEGQGLELGNCYGMTALHCAAVWGHTEIVEYLVSQGANATARDVDGMTPLMDACMEGRLGAARVLVPHVGVEGLQEQDKEGWTALHFASRSGHAEVMRFLLVSGANPRIRDTKGRTAAALAEEEDDEVYVSEEERERNRASSAAVFEVSGAHAELQHACGWPLCFLVVAPFFPCSDKRGQPIFVQCMVAAVWQWWKHKCDLECRAALCRAICLHKVFTAQRDIPTAKMPTYLEARVAAGHVLPSVEVVSLQSEQPQPEEQMNASIDRQEVSEDGFQPEAEAGEEVKHAVLAYVVTALNEELVVELLEGFHGPETEVKGES